MSGMRGWTGRGGAALLVCGLLGGPTAAGAQDRAQELSARGPEVHATTVPGAFEIERAASGIRVDGHLDEAMWANAVVVPIGYEVDPGDNLEASVRTECYLAYDPDNLYLGCRAHDPRPDAIRAFLTDRDGIDGQDRITLTLDPFLDQRRAFQFSVSALGVQSDAILAQQGAGNNQGGPPVDPAWDAVWTSAGAITDDGFEVEAAIPFRSLRFPSAAGSQTWGMILTRWWPRSSAVEFRSAPLNRDDSCVLCQANRLEGLQGMSTGAAVQIAPTFTASRLDERPENGLALVSGGTDPEMGVDAKWGITSDLTLDLTANPDFSQVEADVAQLAVNTRFALFFPEKRPFFLEGADFFGTPLRAVFTRSIAEPTVGSKVTGKVGANAVGLLVARDRVNNLLIPSAQSTDATTLDEGTTTTVARIRRDVGSSSSVGALVTSRLGQGYHNTVGGVDFFLRPLPSLTLQGQALRSSTAYPDAVASEFGQRTGSFGGTAANAQAQWSTRNWQAFAQTTYLADDYRADAGFTPQAGLWGRSASVTRLVRGGTDRWFTQLRFIGGLWRQTDMEGHVLHGGHWFGAVYAGPLQSVVGLWPNFVRKYDAGQNYHGLLDFYFDARVRPFGALTLGMDGQLGDELDYANGGVGKQVLLQPLAQVRFGRHLEAVLQHTYHRLDRDGGRVFTAQLTRLRAVWSFSPRSFVRAVVQRQDVTRNPALNAADADRVTQWQFAQVTYGYKVDPQTVLFVGYGDDRRGWTDPQGMVRSISPEARSFFLKLGYAWRP